MNRFGKRVRWFSVTVTLVLVLIVSAILWVLIAPSSYGSCLVLVAAAVPLAILGRDAPR